MDTKTNTPVAETTVTRSAGGANVDRGCGLEFHPLANLFPLIEGEEFYKLVDDISKNGLRQRIVLFEGKILDGRNRYLASREAGYTDPNLFQPGGSLVEEYNGDNPLQYVVSLNLNRRHLTDQQRAAIAAELANVGHGGHRIKSPLGDLLYTAVSQAEAAKLMNVSKRSVERAVQRKRADLQAHEDAKSARKPKVHGAEGVERDSACKTGVPVEEGKVVGYVKPAEREGTHDGNSLEIVNSQIIPLIHKLDPLDRTFKKAKELLLEQLALLKPGQGNEGRQGIVSNPMPKRLPTAGAASATLAPSKAGTAVRSGACAATPPSEL
jgi:hypothetical protein